LVPPRTVVVVVPKVVLLEDVVVGGWHGFGLVHVMVAT